MQKSTIVVESQVNFGIMWPFCTNHGQYMCSNHPWPLLWKRTLNRWYWPHYPASYEIVTGVSRKCLNADVNIWIRHNEKGKRTFCSACMCYGFVWPFCMDEEVCLLLCMEGSLFCFCKMTMAVEIWIEVTWCRDDTWNLSTTTWQFSKLGKMLRHSWWNLLSWSVGWWYSRGARAWSLHPYT